MKTHLDIRLEVLNDQLKCAAADAMLHREAIKHFENHDRSVLRLPFSALRPGMWVRNVGWQTSTFFRVRSINAEQVVVEYNCREYPYGAREFSPTWWVETQE